MVAAPHHAFGAARTTGGIASVGVARVERTITRTRRVLDTNRPDLRRTPTCRTRARRVGGSLDVCVEVQLASVRVGVGRSRAVQRVPTCPTFS